MVFATTLSLSTYANNTVKISQQLTKTDTLDLKALENELKAYDADNDFVKLTNIKSRINSQNEAECSITFSMEAEVSIFGTGVKFGVSCTFTAANCAEAGRQALAGCIGQINNLKSGVQKMYDTLANLF